ncbi:MAG TPA: hypothetical protein VH639_05750 [Bryobacteraceae bacterium]|jgi:hypothetical protein
MPLDFRPKLAYFQILLAVLVLLLFARWLPHQGLPAAQGDSGAFLYAGQQLNGGLALYSEVWDHKAPLVHYLNALSLRLTPGRPLGVIVLACLFTLAFCWITVLGARRWTALWPAILAGFLLVNILPGLTVSPNFAEIFGLPFQAAAFWLMMREFLSGPKALYPAVQGIFAAVLFALRPNEIAVSVLYMAVAAYHYFRVHDRRRVAIWSVLFGAAFVASTLLLLLPVISRGALGDYYKAVFVFNREYSRTPIIRHFYAVAVGALEVSSYGASLIAAAMSALLIRERASWSDKSSRFAMLAFAFLLLEILFSAISGMAFEHYFLMWTLPLALMAAAFFERCGRLFSLSDGGRRFAAPTVVGACALLAVSSTLGSVRAVGETYVKFIDKRADVVQFVRQRAEPSDRVFVWSDRLGDLAFRLGLKPASRFFSTVPMLHSQAMFNEFSAAALTDVEKRRPRFVIDAAAAGDLTLFSPPSATGEIRWEGADAVDARSRLQAAYSLVYTGHESGVKVYERAAPR